MKEIEVVGIQPYDGEFASAARAVEDEVLSLVEGCRREDQITQRALFEACRKQVRRFALRIVGRIVGRGEVAGVALQIFLKVFRGIH